MKGPSPLALSCRLSCRGLATSRLLHVHPPWHRTCEIQRPTAARPRLPHGGIDTPLVRKYGTHSPNATRHVLPGIAASMTDEPTIYALSTAPGKAAIAIIRLSGTACISVYHALCPSRKRPEPRYAAARSLYDPGLPPSSETLLDSNALVLYFPSPKTVTGEDVLELHVHGGPATVKAVLAAIPRCISVSGAIRYAEPGEFTRRAFLNDRLSLTQVEALGDTLAATTEQQRRLSVRGTTNQLTQRYEAWRKQLLYARGELEALIDFSEDQHFDESPALLTTSVAHQVRVLIAGLEAHSRNAIRGELLRNGIRISLLGAPNAGKSSLLNRIVGREAAIVSQEAGTTRDVVEVGIDLGGYLCRLGDTAGLRKAHDTEPGEGSGATKTGIGKIEEEGMRRAKQSAADADVVVVVFSIEASPSQPGTYELVLDSEVLTTAQALLLKGKNVVVLVNKVDCLPCDTSQSDIVSVVSKALPDISNRSIHCISCKENETIHPTSSNPDPGQIQLFLAGLASKFGEITGPLSPSSMEAADSESEVDPSIWQESLGATERHRLLLKECTGHLRGFLAEVENAQDGSTGVSEEEEVDIVLAAESLRGAATCLARITGKGEAGDVEDVLGVVFEK